MKINPIQLVDFIRADGTYIAGLVPVHDVHRGDISVNEQSAIFEAASFERIDYIFFRRFEDGRSSQIAAYIVDNSDRRLDENVVADLHRQVWLQGIAPLLYVSWPSRIDVLTCVRGADFWKDEKCQYSPAKSFDVGVLKTASAIAEEIRKFSAWRLSDGTFWEEPEAGELADHDKCAHQALIQAIVEADSELAGESNPALRRLLLLTVLIKYLEDRKVFPSGWFGKFQKGAKTFLQVLEGSDPEKVYRLLENLERKFNGDIFALPREGRDRLNKKNLRRFAELVEARTLSRQRYLWEQFSFRHLPVEIISHLYQRFVGGGHGAVYTPPFLASLLLDYVMPYSELTGRERILDPACGSGVFLVGAFRRLIIAWRSLNDWQRPDVITLKRILRESIYGIELDPDAVHLTAFSLSLAICDALQPEVIWRDLRFDPLHKSNLVEADFFRVLLDSRKGNSDIFSKGFDIVLGNPPFESELSDAGAEVNKSAQKQESARGALPDKQMAYLFLEQALGVLRTGGRVCLIQPSGLLYKSNVQAFRRAIFRKHKVERVLDFTSIRNLYEADPKTIAVLVHGERPSQSQRIDHLTFRRTLSVHERLHFELDHYDYHRVSQKEAETDPYVWRANLLGGGRLFEISQRLRSMRTLEEYISQQEGWDYGEGYIAARTGRRTSAPFLTGKPLLPTDAFTDNGVDETQIGKVKETHFRSAYTEDRYRPPLVLIRKIESFPTALWNKGFLAYRNKIVGIHAPQSQEARLREVYNNLCGYHDIYRFCAILHSTESLVVKATAYYKQDIDILPYPEDMTNLSFSFWEEALCEDVLQYMAEYVRLGQNSELLERAANTDNLREYSEMFVRMLGSVYDNLKTANPLFLDGLICQPFYFGKQPNLAWLANGQTAELRMLIYNEEYHKRLRTIRVLRFYSENVLLIIKPDRLRYWIRSTAIRDADETLVDLYRQGY